MVLKRLTKDIPDPALGGSLGDIMSERRREVGFRLIMMATMIVFFSHYGPLWEMIAWGAVYLCVTGLEIALPTLRIVGVSAGARRWAALLLLSATTLVFGFPSVMWGLEGGLLGVSNGIFLLGGAMLNTVLSTRGCKPAFIASITPLGLYLLTTAAIAAGPHLELHALSTIAIGGAAMALTAIKLWRGSTATRSSELAALAALRLREVQLGEALQRAEAASLAKGQFLANMSHEIRTPLNGVLGMAQVMAAEPLSEKQRGHLSIISESGRNLLALLNDLLDLSKIEAGKVELEEIPFSLRDVCEKAVDAVRAQAAAKAVDLYLHYSEVTASHHLGDPTRVRQILLNLISNAIKFTEIGSVTVRMKVSGSSVSIEVADTGIGMTAEQVSRLFQPFSQGESSTTRRFGGSGLGLAITRQLVELMGGEITIRSDRGIGSTFMVRLVLTTADPALLDETPGRTDALSPPPGGLRILAAEDNLTNQLVLKALLQHLGAELTMVEDGAAAVAAWESAQWDLVLMDVNMPEMDGVTATRWIRDREAKLTLPPTPIIALTANVMTHHLHDYIAAGFSGHVAKPIQTGALFQAIDAALSSPDDDLDQEGARAVG